jgi:hypothetical protein
LSAAPLVMGFSILGDTGALGVRGEVGDRGETFVGGTCLVGGGLMGRASLVVLSLVGGGGLLWFAKTASFILLPIILDGDLGVPLPFVLEAAKSFFGDVGDLGA